MRSFPSIFALGLLLLAAGCGDAEEPSQPPAAPPTNGAGRVPVEIEAVSIPDRARFALDRILRGPEPTSAKLGIRHLHATSLAMAESDLVDMAQATLALLDDEALIARLTKPGTEQFNAWQGVMSVLMAIPQKPADLVVRWTAPALERPNEIALLRRAIRTLTTIRSPAAAPTILAFLEAAPGDRIIAPKAFTSLETLGSPWRERAVAIALKHGGPHFWSKLSADLSLQAERSFADPKQTSALTWAAHWMEGSGPRTPSSLPREQKHAWSSLRPWTDPLVRRTTRRGEDGALYRVLTYGVLPLESAYGAGWFSCDTAATPFVPTSTLFFTGREPAAEARCTIASRGHVPYQKSRDAEGAEAYKAIDAPVYYAAHHCVDASTEGDRREENLAEFVTKLELAIAGGQPGIGKTPTPTELMRLIGGLPDSSEPRVRAVLIRVLKELRPAASWRGVIYAAHDRVVVSAPPKQADLDLMESLAIHGSLEDRGVALDIIRRSFIADYIPFVERILEEGLIEDRAMLWRTLMFLYTRAPAVEPRLVIGFVERAATWVRETVEPERGAPRAAAVAGGLLDFGEPGARAYARFLRGPNRAAYVRALLGRKGVLAPPVVTALLEPLDRDTPPAELRRVMEVAWRSFPASAAGELAALARELTGPMRTLAEAALVRVRHRGPRAAR